MIADRARLDAYRSVIERHAADRVVLDLGAGPGVLSLLAARAGARHVHAVETNTAVTLLDEMAADNGLSDRITVHHGDVADLELDEPVDLIVSDLRGRTPLAGTGPATVADAVRRRASEDAIIVPRRDHLMIAPVARSAAYDESMAVWGAIDSLDLTAAARHAANSLVLDDLDADSLLAPAQRWATIEYGTEATTVSGTARFTLATAATMVGLAVWFDTELDATTGYSSGPAGAASVYGQVVLPAPEPVRTDAGDVIAVTVDAAPVGDDYTWSWSVSVTGSCQSDWAGSTLAAEPLDPRALRAGAAGARPGLSSEGAALRSILDGFAHRASVRDAATRLVDDGLADDLETALGLAGDAARRHGRK